jgi:hypothetical protein
LDGGMGSRFPIDACYYNSNDLLGMEYYWFKKFLDQARLSPLGFHSVLVMLIQLSKVVFDGVYLRVFNSVSYIFSIEQGKITFMDYGPSTGERLLEEIASLYRGETTQYAFKSRGEIIWMIDFLYWLSEREEFSINARAGFELIRFTKRNFI